MILKLFKNNDCIGGLFTTAMAIASFVVIATFDEVVEHFQGVGPTYFPNLISGFLLLFGVLLFLRGWKAPATPGLQQFLITNLANVKQALWLACLMVLTAVGLDSLGYLPSVFLFAVLGRRVLGERRYLHLFIFASVLTFVIWFVFQWSLNIVLPRGIVGEFLFS